MQRHNVADPICSEQSSPKQGEYGQLSLFAIQHFEVRLPSQGRSSVPAVLATRVLVKRHSLRPCILLATFPPRCLHPGPRSVHQPQNRQLNAYSYLPYLSNSMASTAMPEMKPEERLSMEELGRDKSAAMQKGGTAVDDREMSRMGKKQELRVSGAILF